MFCLTSVNVATSSVNCSQLDFAKYSRLFKGTVYTWTDVLYKVIRTVEKNIFLSSVNDETE